MPGSLSLLHILLLVDQALALPSFLPKYFTFWQWQSAIVVQDTLWIDGGEIWAKWNNQSVATPVWNYQTIAIALTEDWSTETVGATLYNHTSSQTTTRRPDLFLDSDGTTIFSLGGLPFTTNGDANNFNNTPLFYSMDALSPSSSWTSQLTSYSTQTAFLNNPAYALAASSEDAHYSLGGENWHASSGGSSQTLALSGMNILSFGNMTWINDTSVNAELSQKFPVLGGAQYVPLYNVILFFGGKWPRDKTSLSGPSSLMDLGTIYVYDIETETFFTQIAGGIPPIERFSFCTVSAGSNSSISDENSARGPTYEIFLFGGAVDETAPAPDNETATELATVYILTLPAFEWIQVPNPAPDWRADHSCTVLGNRQMLSIGGAYVYQNQPWGTKNDTWNGLRIFDMVDLVWTDAYSASADPYVASDLVVDFYGNNSRFPASWGDTRLEEIFNSTGSPPPQPESGPSKKTSHTGAIVGGVVGGLAVIAALAAGAFWWMHRRQRKGSVSETHTLMMEMDTKREAKELTTNTEYIPRSPRELPSDNHPSSTGGVATAGRTSVYELDGLASSSHHPDQQYGGHEHDIER